MQLPRERIADTIVGDVLEVGPGSAPFPTAAGSRVVFVDKSVPGGRDATWPELVGTEWGPRADFDLDLDVAGLGSIGDESFDVVIASHIIEHLANPFAALAEFRRVLRPEGRLVLIVPDRSRTFDAVRQPTTADHVLREFREGVTEVSDSHIREFCDAIYSQDPVHPPGVREWYDPEALTPQLLDLHRRRSIHVHCWNPEEFLAALAVFVAEDAGGWALVDQYSFEDAPGELCIEFGLVLRKVTGPAGDLATDLVRSWTTDLARNPAKRGRLPMLVAALLDSATSPPVARDWVNVCVTQWAQGGGADQQEAQRTIAELRQEHRDLNLRLDQSEAEIRAIQSGASYRLARAVGRPVRAIRAARPRG